LKPSRHTAATFPTVLKHTFLNVNGDTFVAMLVANADDEIDRDDYNGTKTVIADEVDLIDLKEQLERADAAD